MARGGRTFNRGRGGRFNSSRGRFNRHFNKYKGSCKIAEGGRGEDTSSQRKGFIKRDDQSKTVMTYQISLEVCLYLISKEKYF